MRTVYVKMLNIINHQGNTNQNFNEISPHSCQNGYHQKDYKYPHIPYVYIKLNHFAIHLKLTQYLNQLWLNFLKKKRRYDEGSKGQRERLEDATVWALKMEDGGS